MKRLTDTEILEHYIVDVPAEEEQERKNEVAEESMARPDCLCAEEFPSLRADDHDYLLRGDEDVEHLVQLFEDIVARSENFRTAGQLRFWEFRDFVAAHNWKNPVAMLRFAYGLRLLLEPTRQLIVEARMEHDRRERAAKGAA